VGTAILIALLSGGAPSPPPAAAPETTHVVRGELVRLHFPRRAIMLKTGTPARELEIKVDAATVFWTDGRRTDFRDLHPGDDAVVVCADRRGVHRARLARLTAARR
jgi:hypothetical protein